MTRDMRYAPSALACLLILPMLAILAGPAYGQGNIFGTVQNADFTPPATGDLYWTGFLDGTDQEIRIESNTGAGYDGTNWFDDFQNYTTEAAGNPFDYVYVNLINGEALRLVGTIPDNSFYQEDVVLAEATVPPQPTGFTAVAVSSATVALSWDAAPGLTWHVYRRTTSNNSLFRRLDDPTGNLANPGVADPYFDDNTSDGAGHYTYLIIAEDATGNYSAHSAPVPVDASGPFCACDCHGDPQCDGATDVLDVVHTTDVAFRNGANMSDPNPVCPVVTTDTDCNGVTDIFDLVHIVNVAFRNEDPAANFCDPCTP